MKRGGVVVSKKDRKDRGKCEVRQIDEEKE